MTGTITSVSVRLNGLSHTDPDTMDMLLVAPDGKAFVFWSDIGGIRSTFDQTTVGGTNVCRTQTATGGACSISNFTITVADDGPTRLPDGGTQAGRDTRVLVNNTTYQPANGDLPQDAFSNTNPAFNAGVTLTTANFAQNTTSTSSQLGGTGTFENIFNGSAGVNGDWKLYIVMDGCCFTDGSGTFHNLVGSLTSWSLIINTASNNAVTSTALVSNNNPSLLPNNNSVTFTATVTAGGNPVTLGAVSFFRAGNISLGTNVNLNGSGQASVTVTNLTEQIHTITAQYSGATGFGSSTGTLQQTVNRATTINGNTFCNTGPIAIPATFTPSPAATPYPSNLFVTGLGGNISKVTLTLNDYNISSSSDADVLLVGPGGQKFLPFSYIGGAANAVSNVNITLDDTAANALPSTGGVASGTFRPTVHNTFQVSFPSPAPAGPHAAAAPIGTATFANTFGGLAPNGTWQLFVSTHGGVNAVSNFNGGWCLTFTTTSDPGTTTTPSVSPTPSALNQSTTVAALVTNATTSAPVNARGSVSFFEGSTLLAGPLNVSSIGTASFNTSQLTQGAHFIDANYSGAPGFFNLSTGRVLHYVDAPTTTPSAGRFCNASTVTFPNIAGASGNPYPTRVNVSGVAGVVERVSLSLNGLSHNFPRDLDMMLTGPNGNSLVVLSDVGNNSSLTTPINLILDSLATSALPTASVLTSGTFLPTDVNSSPADSWASPAPTTNVFSAASTSLGTAFNNSNPNGLWTLWTTNDGAGQFGGGSLAGGWCVNIIATPPQLTISKTHVGNFTQGQTGAQYTVTVGSSGPGSTVGTITMVDTVPAGLTITGMSGSGWNCTVATGTCTTNAVLAANATLPAITVTVSVASNASSSLVNSVSVSGGGATGATATDTTTITPAPSDLTISKVALGGPFQQGGTVTYDITVTNSGIGQTTSQINMQDIIPTGLTATSATGTNWTCTLGATVTCTRTAALAPGANSVITLVANIAANAAASITNTATVSGGGETVTNNNSGSSMITVTAVAPDLTISKVAQGGPFQQGGSVSFAITVSNSGNGQTTSPITMNDIMPTGLTATSASGTNWTCTLGATVTCSRTAALAPGANSVITLVADIAANAPASITNTATVSGGGETVTNNNSGSSVINVAAVAPDLTVTKVAQGGPFQQGGSVSFAITVSNSDNGQTTSPITMNDIMPTGLTATSASGTNWTCTLGATVTCTRTVALASGADSVITLVASIASNAPTSITNTATVATTGESNTGNNSGSSTINVTAVAPDLTVTKVAQGGPFQQGGSVSFAITVSNSGNGQTTSPITMTDVMPTGLTATSATGTNWSCTLGATVTCTRTAALASGANSVITLVADIAANAPASITNTATVSGGGETVTNNNSGSSVINVAAVAPDLTVTKVAQGGPFQQGGSVSFAITVSNSGNGQTTSAITMNDIMPTGLTATSATGTNWTCSLGATVTCTSTAVIQPNGTSVITLTANIAANAPASITNTATVATTGESNTGNNSGSSVISVGAATPDLTISQTTTATNIIQGSVVRFDVRVSNVGTNPTTAAIGVNAVMPTGLTIDSVGVVNCASGNSSQLVCSFPSLAPGADINFFYNARVALNAPASITNTATVSGGGDTTTGNNSSSVTISVGPRPLPDLTITKLPIGAGPFAQGSTMNFGITVRNLSQTVFTQTNTTVNDTMPTGLTVTSVSGSNWSCTINGGGASFSCTRGASIAPNTTTQVILVTTQIASNAPASITNTATVTGDDDTPGNNSSSATITVTGPPDLTVSKVAQGAPFQQGGSVSYAITVSNSGNGQTTSAITMNDIMPTGLTATSATGANWTCSLGATVTCSRTAALAPGANSVITLVADIAANAPASITNTATVSGGGETVTNNNSGSSVITVGSLTGVTINVPAGVSYSFNGNTVTGSQTFNVAPGTYVLATTSPQPLGAGVRAVFTSWSNGQPISHNVTVGSTALTITGNFTTQFQLTTAASPSNGGSVSPASGTFYDSGTVVNVTATANGEFTFANWTGPVANASSAASTVVMDAAKSVTANFTAQAGVTINVPAGVSYTFNGNTVTGSQTFNVAPGTYTLATTTPQSLGAGVRAVFASWSNGQPISHPVTVGSTAVTITGNFTTQFQLTTAASPSNGGTVSPASGTFFDSGTVVNVTATANGGFTFANWTGPVANASSAATTVVMDAAKSVTANFAASGAPVVTGQFTIVPGPLVFNRGTGRFSQSIRVTNNGAALAAAAYVFDNLAAGYTVFGASGMTAATSPAGSAYREIGAIGAGASVTFVVEFTRVGTPALTYTPRLLGAGQR